MGVVKKKLLSLSKTLFKRLTLRTKKKKKKKENKTRIKYIHTQPKQEKSQKRTLKIRDS